MTLLLRAALPLVLLMLAVPTALVPAFAAPSALSTNFSMSASPTSLTIVTGFPATSTITLKSHSLVGLVALSASVTPPGPSTSLSPLSVFLNGTSNSILTISTSSSTLPGNYTVKVTGTSALTSRTVNVSVNVVSPSVPDFSISLSPSTITMSSDTNAPATVTVSSLNGFAGTVSLTSVSSPSALETTLNPTSLTVSSGGASTSTLTLITSCGTPIGVYSVKVTGNAAGGQSHTTQASVTVQDNPRCHPDFSLALNPVSLDINAGSYGISNVTLTSVNGFAGDLTVTLTISQPGFKANLTLPSVLLKTDAANFTIVTVDTSTTTSAGTYTVTVAATNGTVTHFVNLTVVVSSPSSSPPPPPPTKGPTPSSNLPGIGGLVLGNFLEGTAIFVALVAGALVFLRIEGRMKRGRKAPTASHSDGA